MLITHLHLVLKLRISTAIPLPPLYSFMVYTRTILPFTPYFIVHFTNIWAILLAWWLRTVHSRNVNLRLPEGPRVILERARQWLQQRPTYIIFHQLVFCNVMQKKILKNVRTSCLIRWQNVILCKDRCSFSCHSHTRHSFHSIVTQSNEPSPKAKWQNQTAVGTPITRNVV